MSITINRLMDDIIVTIIFNSIIKWARKNSSIATEAVASPSIVLSNKSISKDAFDVSQRM